MGDQADQSRNSSSSSLRIITNLDEPAENSRNKKRAYVPDSEDDEDSISSGSDEDRDVVATRRQTIGGQTIGGQPIDVLELPTPGRKASRRRSKIWDCFVRGEYNRTAHRFAAECKFCGKKYDGRVKKLRAHILECSEINAEDKLVYTAGLDSSESENDAPRGPITPNKRGRPASKLWECFGRGEYSKSAHRFAAICKYCNAQLDGRKAKLKSHILLCPNIDEPTREIYRAIKVVDPAPTPKKSKPLDGITPRAEPPRSQLQHQHVIRQQHQTQPQPQQPHQQHHQHHHHLQSLPHSGESPSLIGEPDDQLIFPAHNFTNVNVNVPIPTAVQPIFQFASTSEPYDFLLRFFIANNIPLSSFNSTNLSQFITSLNPQFPLLQNKQDVLELITRNYNLLKQQEINVLKNENFITLIFHGEEDENTKISNYFTSIMLKNYYVYNIHSFHLFDKNEVHFFSNRWRHAIQSNGKVVAINCDTEENYKLANEWISHSTDISFHRIVVLRSFNHLLVEMASSILGHPWITPILSDALTLVKTIHTLRLNNPASLHSTSHAQSKKYEHLLEDLNDCLIPIVRNQFLSILLMIESIIKNESTLLELKAHLRGSTSILQSPAAHNNQNFLNQHHQITNLFNLLNATKFWTAIKLLYLLCKPFLDILYQLENLNDNEFITLVETTAYWIYLTNHLESSLLNSGYPEDFRQYVINIYNLKMEFNNYLIHDAYKLALFLSPKYVSGLQLQKESFFKSLLKFSCTFIQNYGYNEQDCSKLISQMLHYRNQQLAFQATGNTSLNSFKNIGGDGGNSLQLDTNTLKDYWENYSVPVNASNGKEVYQIIQTVAFLLLDIVPYIKGRGTKSSLYLNGQLGKLSNYENFFPELSNEINNSQIISMIETIRVHEFFAW